MSDARPTAANPAITTCGPVPGYSPGIGRYVAQLAETRDELLPEVRNLTPEQLAWHPERRRRIDRHPAPPRRRNRVVLVLPGHLRPPGRRLRRLGGGVPAPDRDRAGDGKPLAYFTDRLERVRADVLAALRDLTDDDLPRLVGEGEPDEGEEPRARLYSIDWVLFHLVHHEAHHAGQVELLRRLLPRVRRQAA